MKVLVKLIVLSISIYVASVLITDVKIDSFQALIVITVVLALVNTFVKPILVLLTLPLTIISLGLFLLVLNGLLVFLVDFVVPGFAVGSFFGAILFSIVVSLTSWLLSRIA